MGDVALHHGDIHRFLRLRGEPLQLTQRPGQQQQRDGDGRCGNAALIDGIHQQSGDRHQDEGDGINPQQRCDAFQRAVELTVAELQPGETGQHPAAQKLSHLPQHRRGNRQAVPTGGWPQARQQAGEQPGIQRQVGGQQGDQENIDGKRHAAEVGNADVNPVDAGAKQAEPPAEAEQGGLSGGAVEGNGQQAEQGNNGRRPNIVRRKRQRAAGTRQQRQQGTNPLAFKERGFSHV
ncbi:hypothetical protein D3C79_446930 [compost metagenome]